MKHLTRPRTWDDPSVQTKQRKRDMRSGTLKVRSLFSSGSHMTVARELARYKLDSVGVQRQKKALKEQGTLLSSMEEGMKIINWEQDLRTQQNSINS